MNSAKNPPSASSAETTLRLNPSARVLVDKLRERYGLTRAEMMETSLSVFDQVLAGEAEVTLPELTHEVGTLERHVSHLTAQTDHLEGLIQLLLAQEHEAGDLVGGNHGPIIHSPFKPLEN